MSRPSHPLRCRCGALQGHVDMHGNSNRMVCYCQDCQAFARFLGPTEGVLDAQGGCDLVQLAPHRIHIDQGAEHLAVMRLSDKGLLRWYAACCRTPVGNTMAGPGIPFTGLLVRCLDGAPLEPAFGPVRAQANTASALGQPKPRSFGMASSLLRILALVLGSRVMGRKQHTPFFTPSGAPVARPTVLTRAQREELRHTPNAG